MVCAQALSAQTIPLLRNYPGTGPYECPTPATPVAPTEDQRVRASQLTSDALQASILGDLEGARALLQQAAEADQTSPEVAYRHARALEDVVLREAAISEYCRAIALGAVDAGIEDGRDRLDALYEIVRERITDLARGGFVSGLNEADAAAFGASEASFTVAIEEVPDWAEAYYNRAIVREQLGRIQESLADYRRYLLLTPSEIDPTVQVVLERIGMLEGAVAAPTASPSAVLAMGMVPGMGHYYTGRGVTGTIVLGLAAGAVVSGLFIKEETIRCLNTPVGGADCPPEEIVERTSKRPHLVPALGAAAGITIIGAIEAFVRARGRRSAQAEAAEGLVSAGVSLSGPSVAARGDRVEVTVLGLRFN
jgi:hypothetical protein